jgi:hypothetical protein
LWTHTLAKRTNNYFKFLDAIDIEGMVNFEAPSVQVQNNESLKDIDNKKITSVHLKELLKLYITLLQIVYILLSFQNISTEKSELFAILDY